MREHWPVINDSCGLSWLVLEPALMFVMVHASVCLSNRKPPFDLITIVMIFIGSGAKFLQPAPVLHNTALCTKPDISNCGAKQKESAVHIVFICFIPFMGTINSIHWPAPNVWVFIAQLVEHCSANAEAMGSKTFFGLNLRLLKSQSQLR